MKRFVAALLGAILLGCGVTGCTGAAGEPFETVGYFIFRPMDETSLDFYVASGYNMVEYCDVSWYYRADSMALESYQQGMRENIILAKEKGLKTYVAILSNLTQWEGESESGNPMGLAFDPANEAEMAKRMGHIRQAVEAFRDADGFTFYAGDPGGVLGISGEGGLHYYIEMAREVKAIVNEVAPDTTFNLNLWAVSQFVRDVCNPAKAEFWVAEGTNARAIIAEEDLLGPDVGIELPGHDYYRMLALQLYTETGIKPEKKFPMAEDVENIRNTGCTRYWAYPHGIIPDITDSLQINTQRIKYYLDEMRKIGMNGAIIGNVSYSSQNADLYTFARLAQDPSLTVEDVLYEFAQILTEDDTSARTLCEIFKYLDNYQAEDNRRVGKEYRLPLLDTRITGVNHALEEFQAIRPAENPDFPLADQPIIYLEKVRNRLYEIKRELRE